MWDFAIIGGGIAGLTAGAHLAPLGRTIVLEGEATLGHHASGRSAALYEAEYGAPATIAVARASLPELQRLDVLSPRGLMLVGLTGQDSGFDRDCAMMHMDEIDLSKARDLVPILNPVTVSRAGITWSAQNIDTDRLMQGYARQIRASGGEIRTGAGIKSLDRTPDGWTLHAGAQNVVVAARRIVNAAGAWADSFARLAGLPPIGIQPHRRSIAQLPPPGGHDVRGWPMMIGVDEAWYAKPEGGRLLVSPAEEHPMDPHDAFADDMVIAEGLARYEAAVTIPVTRVETTWAGLRSIAPDRALVLGPDPLDDRFWWCAGQGGQGFLSAPGAGAVLSELAGGPSSGLAPDLLAALSPARFTHRRP